MTRVIVVGGGISGLTAAAACADAGCEVTLFERDAFAVGQPPLAVLAAPAPQHREVWLMSGYGFHFDNEDRDVLAGGEVIGQCRTVDPAGLIGGWVAQCRRKGVQLHPGTAALGLLRFGSSVTGVETHLAAQQADEVVLAGGHATSRFLAGTPLDIAVKRQFRAYEVRGPGQPLPPGVHHHGAVRLLADPVGRVQVEAIEPAERPGVPLPLPPDVADLPLLEAGEVPLTATPLGGPLLMRQTWLSGVTVVAAGAASLDAAPQLAAALAAGITTGVWT
jgi:glycine/D-amino acid oxidase-like deaminating enzyme